MAKKSTPTAPDYLREPTRQWFASVVKNFILEPHHIRLLTLACEAWDRAASAREVIQRDGLTYTDRFGAPRCRPEIGVERDARLAFARLLRELALDVSEPEEARPPAITRGRSFNIRGA